MKEGDKIYIAGHKGMVGSSVLRLLNKKGYNNIVYKNSKELDLRNQAAVKSFFEAEKPDYVFLCAAKVGGILANKDYKADFIYDNLMIQNNIIYHAHLNKVRKLLFLGSSCIYPKFAEQPIKEEYLLSGKLEPTNDAYAIAKIAGVKLCQSFYEQYNNNFISIMPTNLYGPNDNYDLKSSHVMAALIKKIHIAKEKENKEVELWGSGKPKREFLHVDDLADASLFLMEKYDSPEIINVGTGVDISILDLAKTIAKVIGYNGNFKLDLSKPDGTPRKVMDTSKLNNLGWTSKITLEKGIELTYEEFRRTEY